MRINVKTMRRIVNMGYKRSELCYQWKIGQGKVSRARINRYLNSLA